MELIQEAGIRFAEEKNFRLLVRLDLAGLIRRLIRLGRLWIALWRCFGLTIRAGVS